MQKQFYTYILASERNRTLYIGMTNDLVRRVWEHLFHVIEGFTEKYDVTKLVWYEHHATAEAAILREKRLKRYKREWKLDLIENDNPDWADLYDQIARP